MVFLNLRTFVSTSTKCTCAQTHGTEVSVSVGWSLIGGSLAFQAWVGGRRSGGLRKSLGPLTPSGAQGELVLLNGLFDPSAQAGLVEGLDERLLGRVVLCGCLLGFMVGAGSEHLDPQDGRQLKGREKEREKYVNKTAYNI